MISGSTFELHSMTGQLILPMYVKPYVKRGKSDAIDAEAICEAVTRPTMYNPAPSAVCDSDGRAMWSGCCAAHISI